MTDEELRDKVKGLMREFNIPIDENDENVKKELTEFQKRLAKIKEEKGINPFDILTPAGNALIPTMLHLREEVNEDEPREEVVVERLKHFLVVIAGILEGLRLLFPEIDKNFKSLLNHMVHGSPENKEFIRRKTSELLERKLEQATEQKEQIAELLDEFKQKVNKEEDKHEQENPEA